MINMMCIAQCDDEEGLDMQMTFDIHFLRFNVYDMIDPSSHLTSLSEG